MSRSDQDRFDQAIAHIKKVSNALALDIKAKTTSQVKAGEKISLSGAGYWHSGSAEQHTAVRALLLCQITYFRTPHSKFDFADEKRLKGTLTTMRGKAVNQVNEEIKTYLKLPEASLTSLVQATKRVNQVSGMVDAFDRSRKDTNVSNNPVCYHGVSTWLFAAGFVSKRWFAKEGSDLTGYTANQHLGAGTLVAPDNWDSIPAGYIFNIQKKGDPSTCHWGVSLGEGRAVGCNNTDGSPGQDLDYEPGGRSQYGIFEFRQLCLLLNKNRKYRMGKTIAVVGEPSQFEEYDDPSGINIEVYQINPTTMEGTWY